MTELEQDALRRLKRMYIQNLHFNEDFEIKYKDIKIDIPPRYAKLNVPENGTFKVKYIMYNPYYDMYQDPETFMGINYGMVEGKYLIIELYDSLHFELNDLEIIPVEYEEWHLHAKTSSI